jgi:hypothetical protein
MYNHTIMKKGKERFLTHAMPLHKSNTALVIASFHEIKERHHQFPLETYKAKANMTAAMNTSI